MWLEKQILEGGDLSSLSRVVFKRTSQGSWAGVLGFLCLCHARPPETLGSHSSLAGTLWGGEKWLLQGVLSSAVSSASSGSWSSSFWPSLPPPLTSAG